MTDEMNEEHQQSTSNNLILRTPCELHYRPAHSLLKYVVVTMPICG